MAIDREWMVNMFPLQSEHASAAANQHITNKELLVKTFSMWIMKGEHTSILAHPMRRQLEYLHQSSEQRVDKKNTQCLGVHLGHPLTEAH
jgi:hypothetical protein